MSSSTVDAKLIAMVDVSVSKLLSNALVYVLAMVNVTGTDSCEGYNYVTINIGHIIIVYNNLVML